MTLLIGIPVYGQHKYTHALIADLRREQADFVIIDNRGDYPRIGDEHVITPGRNLGWAGGSNFILRHAFANGYSHAMTLNNDTRLSPGFVNGLLDPRIPDDAGIVVPVYDDIGGHKRILSDYRGPAADYRPKPILRKLPFSDACGLMITRSAWQAVGGFDERSFGRFAWGADVDLCLRARVAGFGVYATEMAYMNHFGRKTAKQFSLYGARAQYRYRYGMLRYWLKDWRLLTTGSTILRLPSAAPQRVGGGRG
ncbi:glycosyltransferase family 2 protein [Mycobacterium sp.]|uniref:glycosyltransferase family 2 protein n=1 Tax=Mycobacterium sp. TaxID=1785 RepID=UPI002DACDE1A|nr:glycosyltransferase family 2 protein [Mycobacterium sp.]